MLTEGIVETSTHGRYLWVPPVVDRPAPLLVGFHGYAENAETQLERLRAIPGSDEWLVISIQALHRFYWRRGQGVVASWMTRQDRELAIADNVGYVTKVLETIKAARPTLSQTVFAGFSQGVAMAFRMAARAAAPGAAVIAVGGDVPPEIDSAALRCISGALVCRGSLDDRYPALKFGDDIHRLQAAGVAVQKIEFPGGHEWSGDVTASAATFLRQRNS